MKMKSDTFAKRWIHLDFHTGPDIPDVGRDFDPEEFAAIMDEARVDACTVFAKCHHGHLYYETKHPARHPHLKPGLNLLGEQIEALHSRGIRAPIYLSVQCDEFAANTHPEWIALHPDGRQVKHGGPFNAAWQILDMSSPYQDYLAEQLAEVLKKFAPVDGIFMDMCWDQPMRRWWIRRTRGASSISGSTAAPKPICTSKRNSCATSKSSASRRADGDMLTSRTSRATSGLSICPRSA
ncbi:MAG: alpha-L-fucosidase [Candidatus Sumerlaeota bacterium]|nr:alpha-L-fucosidase [Candidatus Sumerlaeota bacterium]